MSFLQDSIILPPLGARAPQAAPVLRLPARVGLDVAGYRMETARFQRGEITAEAFRSYRAAMGVYEQRERGRFMVRVRLGAGLASPEQLEHIAQLASRCGDGILHVTTRQDLQIHGVSLDDTVTVQEGLLEVGLSARGGGGGTVRNVTACPRAMTCPKARFAVAPFAIAATEYLLQSQRAFALPRKLKVAFSACADDCAFAAVHDLGFFAHEHDGEHGFSVWAGGGLGSQPAAAIRLEAFIGKAEVFHVAEAVLRMFDRLGDRTNRHKARLRHVVARLGEAQFLAEYRAERDRLNEEGLPSSVPELRDLPLPFSDISDSARSVPHGFLPERDPRRFTAEVRLGGGQISAAALQGVATLARELGAGLVVATQQQDLLVPGIPADQVDTARARLADLGHTPASDFPKVVGCSGATICQLGVCSARQLAGEVQQRLDAEPAPATLPAVRISGCPNACGNHLVAGLGFEGRLRRIDGEAVPHYQVLVGGRIVEGQVRFAERLDTVPATKVPALVAEVCRLGLVSADQLRPLVKRYAQGPGAAAAGPLEP